VADVTVDVFAGIPVTDLPRAQAWHQRLFGTEPSFVPNDSGARAEAIAGRGIEPSERETYENGVRKAIYRDPDGNEIGLGGPPAEP
jgi:hypothetical protein